MAIILKMVLKSSLTVPAKDNIDAMVVLALMMKNNSRSSMCL